MRHRTLVIALLGLTAAACGGDEGASRATQAESDPPSTRLTVTVTASEQAPTKEWTLRCDPPRGRHPDARRACEALAKADDPFAPVSRDQVCTKIYGGPQTAKVEGTWRGKRVDANFSRTDGCELDRWRQVSPVFGDIAD